MNATKLRQQKLVEDARRQALLDARATVRADILLDPHLSAPQLLEIVTRSIDRLINKT